MLYALSCTPCKLYDSQTRGMHLYSNFLYTYLHVIMDLMQASERLRQKLASRSPAHHCQVHESQYRTIIFNKVIFSERVQQLSRPAVAIPACRSCHLRTWPTAQWPLPPLVHLCSSVPPVLCNACYKRRVLVLVHQLNCSCQEAKACPLFDSISRTARKPMTLFSPSTSFS